MKNIVSLLLAGFVAFSFGCKDKDTSESKTTSAKTTAGPTNEELKIGVDQEFENLNPLIKQMAVTTWLWQMAGRNLTTMDGSPKWIPMMAEEIATLENGKARKAKVNGVETIISEWRIRDTYFWGDGTPVTGHDVKFTWQVGQHPNLSTASRETYSNVKDIQIDPKDPKKFTFTWDKARWDHYHLGTFEIIPKHIEEPRFKKYIDKKMGYEKNTEYVKNPTNPGLYNGPYVVSELKVGSHVIFTPNKYWKGEAPKIKKIVVKLIPNSATLEANLRSGTIDMISLFGLKMDQGLKFEKKVKKEGLPYNVNFKPGLIYEHIDLQLKNPVLQDVRVRQALVYSINRPDLTTALFEGKQIPAFHNFAPIDPWFTDDPTKIKVYPFSPRKAKKLLDEAGWKLGKDGIREKDGKKLSFEFMTTAGNKTRELVQTYLQDQWKNVGIDVVIRNEPPRVYFGETVRKSKFKAMAMFAWFSSPESTPKSTLHSMNRPTAENGYQGQNSPFWSNKEVDRLIEEVEFEFNGDERLRKIHKIAYHYTNDVPVIPLYYRSDISVTPKNLKNYFLSGHQFYNTNFVETWNLE